MQGFIESSTVNVVEELVNMIETQGPTSQFESHLNERSDAPIHDEQYLRMNNVMTHLKSSPVMLLAMASRHV